MNRLHPALWPQSRKLGTPPLQGALPEVQSVTVLVSLLCLNPAFTCPWLSLFRLKYVTEFPHSELQGRPRRGPTLFLPGRVSPGLPAYPRNVAPQLCGSQFIAGSWHQDLRLSAGLACAWERLSTSEPPIVLGPRGSSDHPVTPATLSLFAT